MGPSEAANRIYRILRKPHHALDDWMKDIRDHYRDIERDARDDVKRVLRGLEGMDAFLRDEKATLERLEDSLPATPFPDTDDAEQEAIWRFERDILRHGHLLTVRTWTSRMLREAQAQAGRKGKPSTPGSRFLADASAAVYREMTGKPATRSSKGPSPFVKVAAVVFEMAGCDVSKGFLDKLCRDAIARQKRGLDASVSAIVFGE